MFADVLLDSHHQSRRGWAALTSFGIQAIGIAFLLVIPLFYTEVLPRQRAILDNIIVPQGPTPVIHADPVQHSGGGSSQSSLIADFIRVPSRVSDHIVQSQEGDPSNPPLPWNGFSHDIGGGKNHPDVIGSIGAGPGPVLAQQTIKPPVRISVMMEGSLIHRVEPTYPAPAKSVRIQGNVLLAAVIGKDGTVQNLQVVSGHPMLVRAALDAVRQWRYRPYVLNGSPIEVDTQISVNFILAQ
jgi:protein TonB